MANLIIRKGFANERKITFQTRKGNDILNNQLFEITIKDRQEAQDLKKKHPYVDFRTSLCCIYNCHGLTFGSRRARIYSSPEIYKILEEDDYNEITLDELKPGDVAIYYRKGDAQHSGIVLRIDRSGNTIIPIILSKWGSGQEAIHSQFDCPYISEAIIKYYRIKGPENEN